MRTAIVRGMDVLCAGCFKKIARVTGKDWMGVEVKCHGCREINLISQKPKIESKMFEIRDSGTHITAVCTRMISGDEAEHYGLRRMGYADENPLVVMVPLHNMERTGYDPYMHSRTLFTAHKYITENFCTLTTGEVIDVQFILGETATKKQTERITGKVYGD